MRVRVECYSGYTAGERPLRFFVGENEYIVREVLYRWYSPACTCFGVRAHDGLDYILRHTTGPDDIWQLEAVRRR